MTVFFKGLAIYIVLGVVCVASFQYRVYDGVPFHGDESNWLANARAWWLFRDGQFSDEYWQEYDGRTQPHAGHYLYGMVLTARGIGPDRLHRRYSPTRGFEWNVIEGRVPSREVLLLGRRFSALCGALACLVVCEIGRRAFGWIAGVVAALWLAANPMMRYVCQRAMVDGQLTLGLALGVLALMILYTAWQRRSAWIVLPMTILVGGLCGFIASLKINGGILCVIAGGALVGLILDRAVQLRCGAITRRDALQRCAIAAGSVFLLGVIAPGTFYLLNPQFWEKGLRHGIDDALALRKRDVITQQAAHPEHALPTPSRRFATAMEVYFTRWPTLRTRIITDFQNPSLAGQPPRGLWYVEGPFFLLGAWALFASLLIRLRNRRQIDALCVVAVWATLYGAFSFFGIPLLWERYFQKFLLVQGLLFGIGLRLLVDTARRLSRRKTKGTRPDREQHGPEIV